MAAVGSEVVNDGAVVQEDGGNQQNTAQVYVLNDFSESTRMLGLDQFSF